MKPTFRASRCIAACLALVTLLHCHGAAAQYTPVFYDGFAVTTSSFDLNAEASTRQSGSLAPISLVANTTDSTNDYHHQVYSIGDSALQPLLIASDTDPQFLTNAPVFAFNTMISPDFNFKGTGPNGVIGKRVTFNMDVGVLGTPNPIGQSYITAGITIGAPRTLVDTDDQRGIMNLQDDSSQYFGLKFVEDTFSGLGYFIQAFDGLDVITYNAPHIGGAGSLFVQLDVDDLEDGNPWDGVGSTTVNVTINGSPVLNYTRVDGGYTDNFITLWGARDFTTNGLATHTVDNFTVYAYAEPTVVPGDYNENGAVDAADYTVWQDNLGASIALPGENPLATTPGVVDQEDYDFWKSSFGAAGAGSAAFGMAVPEPASSILWLFAALTAMSFASRHRA